MCVFLSTGPKLRGSLDDRLGKQWVSLLVFCAVQ